jgi:hypothetical protein
MIIWVRTALIAPGKFSEAMAFAKEVSGYVKSKHRVEVSVMLQLGGTVGRIGWRSEYKNLGAFDDTHTKLLGDPGYQELIKRAADLFVAGQTQDSFWRVM